VEEHEKYVRIDESDVVNKGCMQSICGRRRGQMTSLE
jgi:hypothetical protein